MTEPDQPAPDLDAARLQLDAAVAQLVTASSETLHRDTADHPDVATTETEHHRYGAELRRQHAAALHRGDHAGMRRLLRRLIAHEQQARARRTGRGYTPSLLDQLRDAVQSTGGGGGASAGVHRSPIGLAAAELLAGIERRVGRGPLAELIREWAAHVSVWSMDVYHDPDVLLSAARDAEQWVATGRAILNPQRRLTAKGACPVCGRTTAHVRDDTGETVRRPALELNPGDGSARCVVPGCTGYWPADRIQLLAAVLEEQAQDAAG